MASSPFLPPQPITLHWSPERYLSPCFHHWTPNTGALTAVMTKTQVALQEQRQAYERLRKQADADRAAWERLKGDMVSDIDICRASAASRAKRHDRQHAVLGDGSTCRRRA